MQTRLSRSNEHAVRVGRIAGEAFGRNEVLTKILSNLWYADGRRAEATCKRFRALHAPVEKARKSHLRAYLRRPRRRWQRAGRGHPGYGRPDSPERQRIINERRTVPKPANPRSQAAGAESAWLAHLAARGLPPDWTSAYRRDLQ